MKILFKKKIILLSIILILAQLSYAKKQIKMATLAPKSSIWGKLIHQIAKDVYYQTDKELIIKVYYGGVQGDEKQVASKIRLGQLAGGFFSGNGIGDVCKEARILELPFQFTEDIDIDLVYEKMETKLKPYFVKNKYHLLALMDIGYSYFYSAQEINSLNDIRKTKMWVWKGDELATKIMKELKIPAIAISFPEVIPSLQSGLIDGVYCNPTGLLSLQWYTEMKYMLGMALALVSSGVVISMDAWNDLTESEKNIVQQSVSKRIKETLSANRQADKDSLKLLEANIKIIPYDDVSKTEDNLDIYQEKLKKLRSKMFPKSLVEDFETILSTAKK